MSILVLKDVTLYLDEFDASCNTNQVNIGGTAEVKDSTTFCTDGWRTFLGGLKTLDFSFAGFGDFAALGVDEFEWSNIAGDVVHTITPTGDDVDVAYMFLGVESAYRQTVQLGEIHGVEGVAQNRRNGVVRGRLLKPKTTVTGNTNGTGFELGDVSATEKLYVAIHAFSVGTTADIIVESDGDDTFGSATTRTSATVTAAGGTWVTPVAGAITDTWWRVRTANVTGSFSIAVAVGIA